MNSSDWDNLWREARETLGVQDATLNANSYHDPGRRTYETEDTIYKIVLNDYAVTNDRRAQNLKGEFDILKSCYGIPGIPEPLEWKIQGRAEMLALRRLHGEPLSTARLNLFEFTRVLFSLGAIILGLAKRGISHNDLSAENVLVLKGGGVGLIDFDQAEKTDFYRAVAGSFFGTPFGGRAKVHNSYLSLTKEFIKRTLPPRTIEFVRRLKGRHRRQSVPEIPSNASAQLKSVQRAWKIAQSSDASSPGEQVAYYSYDFEGIHFPGERPWKERWNVLRTITDYQGKRILELGCNMALLSASLLKEEKARAALGVDVDADILESAKLVSSALGVMPQFRQQDLDSDHDWETELSSFKADLVFALNVLNWVKDKDRLMRFLGRHREVIFEGHDSADAESERFRKVGFTTIRVIATTERNRPLLHCRK